MRYNNFSILQITQFNFILSRSNFSIHFFLAEKTLEVNGGAIPLNNNAATKTLFTVIKNSELARSNTLIMFIKMDVPYI